MVVVTASDRGNGSGHGDQEAESSVAVTGRFPSPSRPPSYRTGLPIFKTDLSPCNFCLICQSPLGTPSKIFPEACFTKLLGASSPGKLPIEMNLYTPYFSQGWHLGWAESLLHGAGLLVGGSPAFSPPTH